MSYPEIAAAMGRSAHSTIITADQRLAAQAAAKKCVVLPATLEELPLPELIERLRSASPAHAGRLGVGAAMHHAIKPLSPEMR